MIRPPLLERDELLAELDGLLADAGEGRGSLALIGAEAGAGKTSLVRELAVRVGPRAVVLTGACDPLTTPRPLSPLLDIALDPRSGLDEFVSDPNLQPAQLFSEVAKRLRRARPPVALIVEDIHWADESTLDFVRFIGRRVADLNAVVICTYRDDEVDAGHPARLVLGDLATRPTTRRLGIPPLSALAVEQLSGYQRADAERLHRITGGNAFYVTEVVSAGEEVPGSVRDAVLARVRRLSPEARLVVETVATAPRDLEVAYLLRASGAGLEHVDEATAAGVVIAEGDRLRFRHELARSAVESATPLGRQVELPAVGLLLDRARGNGVVLDPVRDAVAIGRLTRLTGGMPLAIELAAGWLRVLALARIADEIEAGLGLSAVPDGAFEPRHVSVRTVFESAWDALGETERSALARLAAFRGGFDERAAREMAEVGRPLLLSLRNRSMLSLAADGRFGWHPLLETYLRERAELDPEAWDAARTAHARYFMDLLREC